MASNYLQNDIKKLTGGNIDGWYEHESVVDACLAIPIVLRASRTIGIRISGKLVEHIWHPNDLTDTGLVVKVLNTVFFSEVQGDPSLNQALGIKLQGKETHGTAELLVNALKGSSLETIDTLETKYNTLNSALSAKIVELNAIFNAYPAGRALMTLLIDKEDTGVAQQAISQLRGNNATDTLLSLRADINNKANYVSEIPLTQLPVKSGKTILSGAGQTQVTIPHGTTMPQSVNVTIGSIAAKGEHYVTFDATNIYINYTIAVATGTNNLTYYWVAVKGNVSGHGSAWVGSDLWVGTDLWTTS